MLHVQRLEAGDIKPASHEDIACCSKDAPSSCPPVCDCGEGDTHGFGHMVHSPPRHLVRHVCPPDRAPCHRLTSSDEGRTDVVKVSRNFK
eukprot:763450-Hanusia_phi.AAC.3